MGRIPIQASSATSVTIQGREFFAFGGCNYVGLAHHPDVRMALRESVEVLGLSTTASRETTADVHTTCLLGAAYILQTLREEWAGQVKLLFQPGEELLPGGASLLIKEGALEKPAPAAIFGQHVEPPLEAGKVGFHAGRYMASADEIYLTIHGKGGHGAMPHQSVDPILIAAHVLTGLQQVISRNTNPFLPAVLTFGHIASECGATNIIPDIVKIKGTFRTLDETWRFEAHERIRKMAHQLVESMGGHCDCRIEVGYPVLVNNDALTLRARQHAEAYLGADKVAGYAAAPDFRRFGFLFAGDAGLFLPPRRSQTWRSKHFSGA